MVLDIHLEHCDKIKNIDGIISILSVSEYLNEILSAEPYCLTISENERLKLKSKFERNLKR